MKLAWARWQDWPLGLKGATVVALPVLLLLLSLYSNYALQRDVSRADQDVQRTLTVRGDIQALHTLIAEAASGVRGYLLTGREEFLSPYWLAKERIPPTLDNLRRLIRDAEQSATFVRAAELVDSKLQSLETLRVEGAQLGPEQLQSHLQSSKAVLDSLRMQIAMLADRETLLLTARTETAAVARRRELVVNVAMAAIGLAGAGVALWLLSSGIIRRVRTAATNAERLASGLPLVEPPAPRDELGELAERLHRASLLLAERAQQAGAASRAKTEFLSRTSHELRTPLNVILGFAQLLEADLRNTPAASSVAQVLGAGRHLLALIDEMLDIARIESGEIKLHSEPVALAPLLREVNALVAPLAAKKAVQIHLDVPADLAAIADRQRLLQVLLNLLTNAVKFNRSPGSVHLTVRRDDDRVLIAVADTGIGIAPEALGRLFAPFERLDAERQGVEGTGLGLTISHQLMKRMQGSIHVASEPGRGSVFTLSLAAAQAVATGELPAPEQATPRSAGQQVPTRRALYVEDNAPNIALMQALFTRRPLWRLHIARHRDEGLRLARELSPDLLLLDLHLAGESGEDLLREIRQDAGLRSLPVAVLSADALPATVERLQSLDIVDYLSKPIDVPRLFRLLDRTAA